MAIAYYYDHLIRPAGRSTYLGQRLRYGVALYQASSRTPLANYTDLHFGANDIAFHPSKTVVAIGAGSYDGGYCFEGELALFDWEKGVAQKAWQRTPEVTRCKFLNDGNTLRLLTHPWDEEQFSEEDGHDPFKTYLSSSTEDVEAILAGAVDLGDAVAMPYENKPVDPVSMGFDVAQPSWRGTDVVPDIEAFFGGGNYLNRSAIWDIKWLNSNQIAVVHDGCVLEIFNNDGDTICAHIGDGEHVGAQLFNAKELIVHVNKKRWDPMSRGQDDYSGSQLFKVAEGDLKQIHSFNRDYVFSASVNGSLLGRCDRSGGSDNECKDTFISGLDGSASELDLGHYDCFNHFCRFDGAERHYFFQSTPKEDYRDKYVCAMDEWGEVARLWPILEDDGTGYSHPMELATCYGTDALGAGLFIAGRRHQPSPRKGGHEAFLYRRIPEWKEDVWYHDTESCVSMMVCHPERPLLACAFLNGDLWFLNSETGEILSKQSFEPEGLPTVIYSLDMIEDKIAIGCLDGRIYVGSIEELEKGGAASWWKRFLKS